VCEARGIGKEARGNLGLLMRMRLRYSAVMEVRMRQALPRDEPAILEVILSAFPGAQGLEISDLVSALLRDSTALPLLSIVAEIDELPVGHILISCARIEGSCSKATAAILAPLSVTPEYQGRGIGRGLISEGLKESKRAGCDLVFVLGHPGYYARHGFIVAGVNGFEAPYPIAEEHADAWMVQELRRGMIGSVSGRILCADSLMDPKHWCE